MKYYEIEGPSPDEALNHFLAAHDIPRDFIEMEVIEQGSRGFIGMGRKNALIKVKFDEYEYLKRRARLTLAELLEKMGIRDYRIEVIERSPDFVLNIHSPDSNLLIGRKAQTLDSLQYILEKLLELDDRSELNIMVDIENYRERVIEQLKEKALGLCEEVKKTGRTAKLPPMVTMVRKEIHLALKSVSGINTVSSGDGTIKEILIVSENRTGGKDEDARKGSSDNRSGNRQSSSNRRRRGGRGRRRGGGGTGGDNKGGGDS